MAYAVSEVQRPFSDSVRPGQNTGCGCRDCRRQRQAQLEALIDGELIDREVGGDSAATTVPTPGRYYAIQHGKGGLLVTAGRAYGLGQGPARLARAKVINDHAKNRRFWVDPSNNFERNNFPHGIIAFSPIFTCGPDQRRAQPGEQRCFARIFIPSVEAPQWPRPDERSGCGVPPRDAEAEVELEMDIADLEHEAANVPVRPRLCLFQNHSLSTVRNHFQCGAAKQARHIGAIASPVLGSCRRRIGATPYDTGADIVTSLEAARTCLGRRAVDDVHIFSHAGPSGVYGTTVGSAGLYVAGFSWLDRAGGGRTVGDVPTAALANNVRFVLHGCNTAAGSDNVARALYRHLAGTLTNPRVYGHPNSGCAGRNSNWREFSNRHPNGRRLGALPDIVSNRPSGGRRGCCGGT